MTYNAMHKVSPPQSLPRSGRRRSGRSRTGVRGGFTLIEVMVALAILMIMLVIMFVPINMGVNLTQIGRARADVQQTSQLVMDRLATELKQAVVVFPNDAIPGITDKAPYGATNAPGYPYYQLNNQLYIDDAFYSSPSPGACQRQNPTISIPEPDVKPAGNTSRIDFLLPKRDNGFITTPLVLEDYLITYYTRRVKVNAAYDPTGNPIELYRAQMPETVTVGSTTQLLVELGGRRYPVSTSTDCTVSGAATNKNAFWLYQSKYGEPNLEPLCNASTDGTHTLMTPRDMGLIAPQANGPLPSATPSQLNYTPNTSFVCEDSNSDGAIDRVKMSMTLAQYDGAGASVSDQRVPLSTTITLPNVH